MHRCMINTIVYTMVHIMAYTLIYILIYIMVYTMIYMHVYTLLIYTVISAFNSQGQGCMTYERTQGSAIGH